METTGGLAWGGVSLLQGRLWMVRWKLQHVDVCVSLLGMLLSIFRMLKIVSVVCFSEIRYRNGYRLCPNAVCPSCCLMLMLKLVSSGIVIMVCCCLQRTMLALALQTKSISMESRCTTCLRIKIVCGQHVFRFWSNYVLFVQFLQRNLFPCWL